MHQRRFGRFCYAIMRLPEGYREHPEHLPRLASDESVQVVQTVLRKAQMPAGMMQLLIAHGEGNRLFLEELAYTAMGIEGPSPIVWRTYHHRAQRHACLA